MITQLSDALLGLIARNMQDLSICKDKNKIKTKHLGYGHAFWIDILQMSICLFVDNKKEKKTKK